MAVHCNRNGGKIQKKKIGQGPTEKLGREISK